MGMKVQAEVFPLNWSLNLEIKTEIEVETTIIKTNSNSSRQLYKAIWQADS